MISEPTVDLSVIIVSWNVRDLLSACLASLMMSSDVTIIWPPGRNSDLLTVQREGESPTDRQGYTAEVVVVDNASVDGSAACVAAHFPNVRLIANNENLGFTRGNNQALAEARGRYVFFLNPDTVLAPDALSTMLGYLELHPEIGALGPQLRYGDGHIQSSRRRLPTLVVALFESTPLAWHWPENPWARRYHMADRPNNEVQVVDWVVGAALMTRRSVLEQVGGFDEGYFMYSEELDWCHRVGLGGWPIVYLPTAQVVHYEGKSSEQAVAARQVRFQTSKVRYFRKFHGPVVAEFLRLAILVMFVVEWCIEGGKWLLGSKRAIREQRLTAYSQILRGGLKTNGSFAA